MTGRRSHTRTITVLEFKTGLFNPEFRIWALNQGVSYCFQIYRKDEGEEKDELLRLLYIDNFFLYTAELV